MTGQINVNKIAARTGTTITIDTGDALDVTLVKAEGSATTNLKQGLCKAWCTAASHSAGSIGGDTFNISSYEDTATARGRPTMTNPINNDYCVLQSTESQYPYISYSVSTTVFELSSVNGTGSFADGVCNGAVLGDLA